MIRPNELAATPSSRFCDGAIGRGTLVFARVDRILRRRAVVGMGS
jgi:hypothetical protein